MNIIIPLGGKGERFIKENYKKPKALIDIFEKTMIEYVLDNLNYLETDNIYIIYNKKLDEYHFNQFIKNKYPYIQTFSINDTKGAVETLYTGFQQILKTNTYHKKTIILDCDTFYTEDIITKFREQSQNVCFFTKNYQENPIYSYIELDTEANIIDIKEKIKISDNANTGAYAFQDINELNEYCQYILINDITFNNEPYTSCVIAEMIKNNIIFKGIEIQNEYYFSLGTPSDLQNYINRTYAFLFDLDGTLVLTDDIYFNVWKEILIKYNISITEDIFKNYIQGNNDEYVNNTLLKNININTIELSTIKDNLFLKNISKIKIIDGVYDFIKYIKLNGYKLSIVTNCNKIVAEAIISYIKLDTYVDFIISNNDVKNSKPHKEPYNNAIKKYNIYEKKCFIFEDSKSGILSAKQNSPLLLIGIETIYNSTELMNYQVDFSIPNYLNMNLSKFFEITNTELSLVKSQIAKTLQCNIFNINFENILKGGFIADVNSFEVKNNNESKKYIIKYENLNQDNGLAIMANKIELYQREYYFYENISKDININIPKYFGLITNDNNKICGLILENLHSKNYIPNIKLTCQNIDISLKIIDKMCKLHSKFWNINIKDKYPELKKTNDKIFCPFYKEFITQKYDIFIKKWENVLNSKQIRIFQYIFENFESIQNNLAIGEHLTLIHGDIKSPNIFYDIENNYEPYFLDWQHCVIGKGVQDLIFFIIESFDIEHLEIMYELLTNYYFIKLKENNIIHYSYEEYKTDLKDAICYVPYFTSVWFGSVDQDELIDKNFPYFFITKLGYLSEYLFNDII